MSNPANIPDEFSLTLSRQDLQLIGSLIPELPHKFAVPLINKIDAQVKAQLEAAAQGDAS